MVVVAEDRSREALGPISDQTCREVQSLIDMAVVTVVEDG
jgi:hypothetical protein